MIAYTLQDEPLPYGPFTADDVQYPASVLDLWSDDELAEIGVLRIPAPGPALLTLDQVKAARLDALAERRKAASRSFSFGGMTLTLDKDTEDAISKAIAGLERHGEGAVIDWEVSRGVFVGFDLATLHALGDAAFLHVQACFSNVKALTALILAAEDAGAVAAVDIKVGWP